MKTARILMVAGSLMLLFLFVFPMWNIRLEAPQYPQKLGMDIYPTKITDENPNDIQNINIMNHYVGMDMIPETIPEFKIFPAVILFMVVAGVIIGWKGNWKWFIAWFVLMSLLGIAGMYDFYLWQYDYGHSLDPKAIIKFQNPDGTPMAYQPPLIGTKMILNFTAQSYPKLGAYLLFGGMFMTVVAAFLGFRESRRRKETGAVIAKRTAAGPAARS